MKVISTPDPSWKKEYDCRCGSVLELEFADLTVQSDQREGPCYHFKCPICGSENYLDYKFVPDHIRLLNNRLCKSNGI
jgi:hypothetical protein